MLAAKVLSGAEVTVGHEEEEGGKWPYAGTAGAIKELGGKHCVKEVTISFPVDFHVERQFSSVSLQGIHAGPVLFHLQLTGNIQCLADSL